VCWKPHSSYWSFHLLREDFLLAPIHSPPLWFAVSVLHLHRKNIRSLEESFCDFCPGILETDDHIFDVCPCATAVWGRLGCATHSAKLRRPWLLGCFLSLPDEVRGDVFLTILWHIWKARNTLIFGQQTLPPPEVLR
jgi:hypothetical protein